MWESFNNFLPILSFSSANVKSHKKPILINVDVLIHKTVKLKSHELRVVHSQFSGNAWFVHMWEKIGFKSMAAHTSMCNVSRWSLSARSIQKLYEIILITASNESFAEVIDLV